MLTHPIALALYRKLAAAPAGWFKTADGKALVAEATAHVKARCGEDEAKIFSDLLTVAEAVNWLSE
jgi:uroporphyrinogen-III decarboxylase